MKQMLKNVAAGAMTVIMFSCTPAIAQQNGFYAGNGHNSMLSKATITSVNPEYGNVTNYSPQKVCQTEQVPIYGNTKDTTDDMIIGGIIGGIIGNQIGKGSGNDVATGVGAMTGAIIANNKNKNNQIIGYRQVEKCYTQQNSTTTRTIVGYKFGYKLKAGGPNMRGYSKTPVHVGQTITVRINTQVQSLNQEEQLTEVERLMFLLEEIQTLKSRLQPHDTGHIHTTISVLEDRVAEVKKGLEKNKAA